MFPLWFPNSGIRAKGLAPVGVGSTRRGGANLQGRLQELAPVHPQGQRRLSQGGLPVGKVAAYATAVAAVAG
ncbi:hypothetical protein B296_00044117 [Ensete ventricosum]|uniref:Uncharacterized protein n=1 Tax=Ensete ventricosum TaxID=4639 RepID=A0A426XR17_ENSVE|nr:hypothetical protein B296_00044117 [Ensete ventricosum]